jgi:hypothetical protein
MNKATQKRFDLIYEKMLAQSEYHGDVEDLVRACAEIAMEESDMAWDCAVEETACNTHPDDELEGFVMVNKPNIYKAKGEMGYDYIEYKD